MKNGRLSVYKIYMYFHKKSKKIIKYKKKEKLARTEPFLVYCRHMCT